jgi:gas vesicle protein GvpN
MIHDERDAPGNPRAAPRRPRPPDAAAASARGEAGAHRAAPADALAARDAGRAAADPAARAFEVGPLACAGGTIALPGTVYEDDELRSLKSRALAYLRLGIPVHFRGRAGMGKTTLAMQLAGELGRPVTFVSGDVALSSADLLGREVGHDSRRLQDRFVQRVTRSESCTRAVWSDGALARAVAGGHTLIYDEFTRTPPETNNLLLPVLEERMIAFATPLRAESLLRAHPEFRAIFTSNPEDYAGVSTAPDALFDRMITFDLSSVRAETEAGIVACRTGIAPDDARVLVDLLRSLADSMPSENPPSVRTALMIGRVMAALSLGASARDERFVQVCLDVLETRAPRNKGPVERAEYLSGLRRRILAACGAAGPAAGEAAR